ncbi:MAG: nucleoside recognition domain-containing protein [bacterium]
MYLFVGKFGAEFLVGLLEGGLFGNLLIPGLKDILGKIGNPHITDFFCGNFGVFSVGITLALGVVLPVLLTFYLFFGFMEDSGYLPRLSILLDRVFKKMGLNGKGVLPLIMGFSCITMALLTTRMLDKTKERNIAALLLVRLPCAPLLAVMFVLFAKLHFSAMILVFGIIAAQVLLIGMAANKIIPGERGDFIIEVPSLRIPKFLPLLKRVFTRILGFLQEAVPVFIAASIIAVFTMCYAVFIGAGVNFICRGLGISF